MVNIVSDILEDGTIRVFDLDLCQDHAEQVITDLQQKEGSVINFDFSSTLFSLFVNSIHILTTSGWSTEDLVAAVIDHSEADDVMDFVDDGDDDDEDYDD